MNRSFNSYEDQAKLKAARAEGARRASLKYRHEHLEERRLMENHWHRKKKGLPLEAPKSKPWDFKKGRVTVTPAPPSPTVQPNAEGVV